MTLDSWSWSRSLYRVLLCLMFYFPCSLVSFKFLPYDLPSVFTLSSLQVCLPLSAVLFPLYVPLVIAPVGPPHLFLVLSLVFVYLVCVFPALLVCLPLILPLSAPAPCSCSCLFPIPSQYVLVLSFPCLFCTLPFSLHFVLFCYSAWMLCCYFGFCPGFIFVPCSLSFLLPSALI